MGIKGLLPFLKDQQKIVNIRSFRGCTAAIDAYCWLHKAVYGCVEQLAISGDDQGQYIRYCEKYWNTLLSAGIKPVLVFDGQNLPAKADTERERRERRKANREKATALLAEGKRTEARQYLERCIDITPQMAHKVIVAAVSQGIDCIVAPYEADAQLAYLNLSGIAQIIISEDSDLLLFGCTRVLFKMDTNGNGILLEKSKVLEHKSFRKRLNFDHFVKMCILSGCDYIASLPGIGLAKACKFMCQNTNSGDIASMLKRLPLSIKLPSSSVTDEYVGQFIQAFMTFKHQVVFDPMTRKRRPLTYKTSSCCGLAVHPDDMSFAGRYFPADQSMQMALGNTNLNTMETLLPKIDPDLLLTRENGKLSMWHPGYQPKGQITDTESMEVTRPESTKTKQVVVPATRIAGLQKHSTATSTADDVLEDLIQTSETAAPQTVRTSISNPTRLSVNNSLESLESQQASDELLSTPSHPQSHIDSGYSSIEVTPNISQYSSCVDDIGGYCAESDEGKTTHKDTPSKHQNKSTPRDRQSVTPQHVIKSRFFPVKSSTSPTSTPNSPHSENTNNSDDVKVSPSQKYKAKFMGALEDLENNPSSKSMAFRWSKSSLHQYQESENSDSPLNTSLNQPFKSPLLKSRLVSSTLSSEKSADGEPVKKNPFKRTASSSGLISPISSLHNPFKKVKDSPKTDTVLGKAAASLKKTEEDRQTDSQDCKSRLNHLTRVETSLQSPFKISKTGEEREDSELNERVIEQRGDVSLLKGHEKTGNRQLEWAHSADSRSPKSTNPPKSTPKSKNLPKSTPKSTNPLKSTTKKKDGSQSAQVERCKSTNIAGFLARFVRKTSQGFKATETSSHISSTNITEVVVDLT